LTDIKRNVTISLHNFESCVTLAKDIDF